MKKVSKKIVGITGANGALGKYITNKYKTKFQFRPFKGKIENKKNFDTWIKKNKDIDIFLHLAAIVPVKANIVNKKKTFLINSISSINIIKSLNTAKLNKLKYFLFSSSSHVYKPSFKKLSENSLRRPVSLYGKSKKRVEDFVIKNSKKIRFRIGIARIFNFYSNSHKNGFFIHDMKKKLKMNNKIFYIKKINTFRDYINIDQLCEILFFMIEKKINKPLNIGSGASLNLITLINLIKRKNKSKTLLKFEMNKFPGLVANISLLRRIGYKKKIKKFVI